MGAHSEKFMNVADLQVLDEDDRAAAQPPPHDQREQQDRESEFERKQSLANKIVTEQVWINPVTSKSMAQPLDAGTDAQLHEEYVISVRKQAEFASRVLHENCPR